MQITIDLPEQVVAAALSLGMTTEEWIQEAISQKLQNQTTPTELEERRLILLAKIFRTYKSPPNTNLEFDEADNSLLMDLAARGFVNPEARGFIRTNEGVVFMAGPSESPLTPKGVDYLERTKIERYSDRPAYKILKEIRSWF